MTRPRWWSNQVVATEITMTLATVLRFRGGDKVRIDDREYRVWGHALDRDTLYIFR